MDVSAIIDASTSKYKSVEVEKDIPVEIDAGLLTVTDINPIDEDLYKEDREAYLQELARDGIQLLLGSIFSLPTQSSSDGPLALLPPATTLLPRAKPLPKPKPPTKWERFAAAKGIQHKVRDKKVWDEEKQEWVNRWGMRGKNKDVEEQWIHELPDNAPDDHNPAQAARQERKARIAKNERQHLGNVARAQSSDERSKRKVELERDLATTRISTASMGKFDKKLEGEPKLRGVKRKFDANEKSAKDERQDSLAILSKLDGSGAKKSKQGASGSDDVLNVRKAIRFASRGRGGVALGKDALRGGAGKSSRGGGGRGKRGGRK
ncbi:hypothetical protein BOTBODRAFT_117992 [Botryobasidium botryosum FD-172 SS1]|uniref:Ribosome biogenesis regulatory protein n=1 Tax=Botryobasidium botryosum (strain FD-172 SS1) TaxID=930990 RepID=A0A067MBC2_BOTB1|nr:hypothetical protein BOTBODRAFT_117992 [Botryobasidium botryosum FD-172 SS1]